MSGTAPESASETSSEGASSESASDDASSESASNEGDDESDGDEGASADGAGAEGEPGKKKRKRKRKKKKPAVEGERRPQAFTHLFEGQPRAHAFRAGEVVAGRVDRVEHGVIVVDLFGKAVAYADVLEPREIPVIEVAPAEAAAPEAEEHDAEAVAAEEAEAAAEAAAESEAAEAEMVAAATAPSSAGEVEAVAAEAESDDEEEAEELAADEEAPAPEPPDVGSIFRGRVGAVAESGHIVLVNRLIDVPAAKGRIAAARDAKKRVRGVVYGFNRGGFDVLVEGVRTFCPAGGMTLGPVGDPNELVGQKLEFTLPPQKGSGKSIIVSRRGILERDLRKAAKQRLKDLQVGQRFTGAVTQVRDYGLLVDLGDGLEGLVHQSEVSWSRAARPADVAKVGDMVEVEVLKVQQATRKDRTGRVSLSIRRCQPDPWDANAEALKPGTVHKGTVTRTAEFGAFILIAPEIEGLLHISELGDRNLKHAGEVLNVGEEIDVLVERVDREARRVSLSRLSAVDLEAIEKGEFDPSIAPKSLKPGNHVTIVIERVENHGILAQVKGVIGRRGRAYLPNRELSAEGADRKKAYAPGKELTVKIIGIDRDGGLKCSVKGRLVDEERRAVRDYRKEAAKQGFGTFGDLLRAKISDDSKP
ncbi:MAG: S1 RNA-binding domain-containing protein [Sandaracinus sp.]|nr:S1 RNA-binding domain-containing protein [Sandaracinus sp.]